MSGSMWGSVNMMKKEETAPDLKEFTVAEVYVCVGGGDGDGGGGWLKGKKLKGKKNKQNTISVWCVIAYLRSLLLCIAR